MKNEIEKCASKVQYYERLADKATAEKNEEKFVRFHCQQIEWEIKMEKLQSALSEIQEKQKGGKNK